MNIVCGKLVFFLHILDVKLVLSLILYFLVLVYFFGSLLPLPAKLEIALAPQVNRLDYVQRNVISKSVVCSELNAFADSLPQEPQPSHLGCFAAHI